MRARRMSRRKPEDSPVTMEKVEATMAIYVAMVDKDRGEGRPHLAAHAEKVVNGSYVEITRRLGVEPWIVGEA